MSAHITPTKTTVEGNTKVWIVAVPNVGTHNSYSATSAVSAATNMVAVPNVGTHNSYFLAFTVISLLSVAVPNVGTHNSYLLVLGIISVIMVGRSAQCRHT